MRGMVAAVRSQCAIFSARKGIIFIQLKTAVIGWRTVVLAVVGCVLALSGPGKCFAQSAGAAQTAGQGDALLATRPWEFGPFVNGGFGTGNRDQYKFLWAGFHAGKVLSAPFGPGLLRGQFEIASEVIPSWQAYTPKYDRANCYLQANGTLACSNLFPTGGTYTGLSITPVILRWNLRSHGRWTPWIQGAGGLIWTNHKFPPVGPYPVPHHLGTSVFNYTPQFGLGTHYFITPRQSISIAANAVHISNASMGDSNPGVNASVQLSIGYTWWK